MRMKQGFGICALLFFGSVLVGFGLSRGQVQQLKLPQTKTSVEGVSTETGSVTSVADGDTLTLSNGERVRLIGVNSSEVNQPNFLAAKQKLEDLVSGKSVQVEYDVEKKDIYGRTLAYIYAGNVFVNLELVKSGLAVAEEIQPDTLHAGEFAAAQKEAKANCLGMWDGLCHQGPSACVQLASIHKVPSKMLGAGVDEWVEIKNTCSTSQNLLGYLIKDNSASNSYTFKSLNLGAKMNIKLHSGCSTDSSSDVYWTCPAMALPVWNNSGDNAYLYDSTGKLVSEIDYP
ncbi:MAG: thermonuclease family protein [Candidatus Levyibacteriota bacterium]